MEDAKNNMADKGEKERPFLRELIGIYCRPAFLICVAVLAVSGWGMKLLTNRFGIVFTKEPLALQKSLDLLQGVSADMIGPYKIISREKLGEDMIKALGTGDYIQWSLEDTSVAQDSPVRRCMLFITYYGQADRAVTHVPDECYIGGGFDNLGEDSVMLNLQMSDQAEPVKTIKTRYIELGRSENSELSKTSNFGVLYFFYVNGVYTGSRTATRLELNKNIFGKHSYYSKIEWSFSGVRYGSLVRPSKPETIEASEKLLGIILPILEKEHWPSEVDSTMKQGNSGGQS